MRLHQCALPRDIGRRSWRPKTTWNVITLPNPQVTPDRRAFAPADCNSTSDPNTPDDCSLDHRFWEEWDFSNFSAAIYASMQAIASKGQYSGAVLLMPLDDVGDSTTVTTYAQNISLMYQAAKTNDLPSKWLYFPSGRTAPSGATSTSVTLPAVVLPSREASWQLPTRR